MSASRIRWAVLALVYAAFYIWYGGSTTPLSEEEVDYYTQRAAETVRPGAAERIRTFATGDDGREFIMVNLNRYREKPVYKDGRKTELSSREVEQLYAAGVAGKLMTRANHPLIIVEPFASLGGEGEFQRLDWDRATFIRYRSRRDFLDFLLESGWDEEADHKWAALERSHSMAARPFASLATIRLVPFLLLLCLGLILDRLFAPRVKQQAGGQSNS